MGSGREGGSAGDTRHPRSRTLPPDALDVHVRVVGHRCGGSGRKVREAAEQREGLPELGAHGPALPLRVRKTSALDEAAPVRRCAGTKAELLD